MSHPRAVLITGCSSGIGRALALECAARGHRVYAGARRPETLAGLSAHGITAVELDVTSPEARSAALARMQAEAGGVDVLVNNAGFGAIAPLLDLPAQAWREQLETNLLAPLELVRLAVPAMVERGGGRVVNIGSVAGLFVTPFAGAYCASKAALNAASEALRMELAPLGVEVMLVRAGAVRTRFAANARRRVGQWTGEGSLYEPVSHRVRERAGASQGWSQKPETCARRIADAMLGARMPALLAVGRGGRALPLLARCLPLSLRAAWLVRRFGLADLHSTGVTR